MSHPIIFVRRMRWLIVTKTTILGLFQLLLVVPIFLNGACNVIHADLMLFELFIIILSLLLELHVGLQKLHSHSSICFSFKISLYYSSWDFFIWINYFNLKIIFNFIYLQFFLSLKFNPNSFDCYFFLIKMVFNFFFYNSILFNFFLLGLILIILIVIFFASIRFFNWLFLFISSFNVNLIVFF